MSVIEQKSKKVQELMETIDRRIQKTKKILSEALIALILEKGYEHVTVQEILDKANVGRSTFYSHYESKDQLLLAGPENLGVTFFEFNSTRKADQNHEALIFLPLFQHAGQNLPLAKAMLGRKGGEILFTHLKNHISRMISEKFKHGFGSTKQEKINLQYCSRAAAAAVMGFMVEWLEDDAKMSVEEIDRLCSRAVTGFFKAAISKRSLG